MAKSKEELLAMTNDELVEYTLNQQTIKADITAQRQDLKNEVKTLKSSNTQLTNQFNEAKTKLDGFEAANAKNEISKKLSSFNIQDKFMEDVITKSNLTLDMEEDKLNEAVTKTLETYPEYKTQHESINKEVPKEVVETDAILEQMKKFN